MNAQWHNHLAWTSEGWGAFLHTFWFLLQINCFWHTISNPPNLRCSDIDWSRKVISKATFNICSSSTSQIQWFALRSDVMKHRSDVEKQVEPDLKKVKNKIDPCNNLHYWFIEFLIDYWVTTKHILLCKLVCAEFSLPIMAVDSHAEHIIVTLYQKI